MLLPRLKDDDGGVREAAQLALWAVWSRSGDARIDALLVHGTLAMNSGQYEEALADFNRVRVRQKPAFAEGWNTACHPVLSGSERDPPFDG